jgi:hypothetical protein
MLPIISPSPADTALVGSTALTANPTLPPLNLKGKRVPAEVRRVKVVVMFRLRDDQDEDLLQWFASLPPRQRAAAIKEMLRRAGVGEHPFPSPIATDVPA